MCYASWLPTPAPTASPADGPPKRTAKLSRFRTVPRPKFIDHTVTRGTGKSARTQIEKRIPLCLATFFNRQLITPLGAVQRIVPGDAKQKPKREKHANNQRELPHERHSGPPFSSGGVTAGRARHSTVTHLPATFPTLNEHFSAWVS
ncbi:hypothetical protein MAFF211491_19780 [Ralstonia solanacearum]|nr:hypothetical protein MAFF211491_19780 [Ralstonia solanacearum]BCM12904.1 hypothetical protein MAFF241648_20940 [Ralstonia solanacearum]